MIAPLLFWITDPRATVLSRMVNPNGGQRPGMGHELRTCEEAAQCLRLHCRTVYRLLQEGRLTGVKVGRQWRIMPADLDAPLRGQPAPLRHAE